MDKYELVNVLKRNLVERQQMATDLLAQIAADDIIRAYVTCPAGCRPIESEVLLKHVKDAANLGEFFLRVMADSAKENILDLVPHQGKRV